MNLSQALRASRSSCIAFAGAGGKTTALFQLAQEQSPAIVTASTHLGAWQISRADRHFIWPEGEPFPGEELALQSGVSATTGELRGDRYKGLSLTQLEALHQITLRNKLPLFLEADGSRQKPLKAPAHHEPVIPAFTDTVVVVAGLSGLGRALSDSNVHRSELFAELIDEPAGAMVTPEMLAKLLTHPLGGLQNMPERARRIALLNQADTPELQAQASSLSKALLAAYDTVIIASLMPAAPGMGDAPAAIHGRHEQIAGIVLAAGSSSRFGKPKQLLDYQGRSFVRRASEVALAAGLSPVVMITGAHGELVEGEVAGLPLMVIRNEFWGDGQSTSIVAGVQSLPAGAGGAIFLLVDQPQVTPQIIQALVERHAVTGAAIVAPLAADRRANPVLFDQKTFGDLQQLTGDVGGRAIFSRFGVEYVIWHDESLLFDVDTEADYRKLLSWGVDE
jgi:molybdenum cofactor cytidylyltransferase